MPELDRIELERYELRSGPAYHFAPDRRDFFKFAGAGIILFLALNGEAQEAGGARRGGMRGEAMPQNLGAWLHIGEDGIVTVYTGKAEVGQNIRTSLTQAVAEELRMQPGQDSHGDGRHRPGSLRYGHVWKPHHADHGAAAS